MNQLTLHCFYSTLVEHNKNTTKSTKRPKLSNPKGGLFVSRRKKAPRLLVCYVFSSVYTSVRWQVAVLNYSADGQWRRQAADWDLREEKKGGEEGTPKLWCVNYHGVFACSVLFGVWRHADTILFGILLPNSLLGVCWPVLWYSWTKSFRVLLHAGWSMTLITSLMTGLKIQKSQEVEQKTSRCKPHKAAKR